MIKGEIDAGCWMVSHAGMDSPRNQDIENSVATNRQIGDHGSINSLRGAVCLGIVILHLYNSVLIEKLSAGIPGRALEFILSYCRLGVESFFVLAGYFLAHTFRPTPDGYLSVSRYIRRRFLRLAIPYWIIVATMFLSRWIAHSITPRPDPIPSAWQMVSAILFVQDLLVSRWFPYGSLWSMAPLFQSYIIWSIAYWSIRKTAIKLSLDNYQLATQNTLIAVSYTTLFTSILIARHVSNDGWQLPGWAWSLAAGSLTYWKIRSLTSWKIYGFAIASLFPIALISNSYPLSAAKVTACCLVLLGLDRGFVVPRGNLARVLSFLGTRSYSIYLIHGMAGHRSIEWLHRRSPTATQSMAFLELTIGVLASILAGLVFHEFVEKPTSRSAGSVEYRR